jgi:archaellum biogenesis protein FlaJ (TadC family)
MHNMVIPLVLVFTVANAIVPFIAEGGSKLKVLGYFAFTSAISGVCLLALPYMADSLFTSVAQF